MPVSGINLSLGGLRVWEEGAVAVALCSGHHSHLLAVSIKDPKMFSE